MYYDQPNYPTLNQQQFFDKNKDPPNIGKHLAEERAFPRRTPPFMLGALPDTKKTHIVFFWYHRKEKKKKKRGWVFFNKKWMKICVKSKNT